MEDWSLQAIVRGSSGDFSLDGHDPFWGQIADHYHPHREFDLGFPAGGFADIFDASVNGSGDELEDLYKPFLTTTRTTMTMNSDSMPSRGVLDFQDKCKNVDKPVHDQSSVAARVASAATPYSPKYKRRKNQHKRVVIQVSAEGLSSDMWAWRKYGQKPIKGSPYPRSYYRCSSSKGCLARKQVEQSCTDPGMFILTYTAEHSHSQPTRRNSLAGTVRQKFPSSKTQQTVKQEKLGESKRPVSPRNPKQVFPQERLIKEEEEIEAGCGVLKADVIKHDKDYTTMSEFEFDEDFFSGLEEFDEFIVEQPPAGCHANSAQQFPVMRSCS